MKRAALGFFAALLLGSPVFAVEGNMALEAPGGLAVDVWVVPDFSLGLESGFEESVSGTKTDSLTFTQRRVTVTRTFPLGLRAQWRLPSSMADAGLLQFAVGQLRLRGRIEAGGLGEPLTGTTDSTFARALYAQRWQWERFFAQVGAGFRFESESVVKVRNSTSEENLSETPVLGGFILNLALGARF